MQSGHFCFGDDLNQSSHSILWEKQIHLGQTHDLFQATESCEDLNGAFEKSIWSYRGTTGRNSLLYLGIVKIGGLKLLRISYYQHDNKDYTYKQAVTS